MKNSTGSVLASGSLYVSIWDNMTAGNMIYNESFSTAIVNGSWSVMLGENGSNNLTLEYGKKYYKDYVIAGEDADFTDYTGAVVERQFFFSPLGHISDEDIVNTTNLNMANLTLTQKVTFALGEVIDNIIDGWITVTGSLNVTQYISVGPLSIGGEDAPNITVSDTSKNLTLRVGSNNTAIFTNEGNLYVNNTLYTTGISDHGAGSFAIVTGGTSFDYDNGGTFTLPAGGAVDTEAISTPSGQNFTIVNSSSDVIATFTQRGDTYLNNTVYFGPSGSIAESSDVVTLMIGTTAVTFDTNGIISPGSGSIIKANQWDYNEGNMTIRNTTQVTNALFTDAGKFLFGLNSISPRVGIGVASPSGEIDTANLVVNGTMRLIGPPLQEPICAINNAGGMYYNTTNNKFYGCNGSAWNLFNMSG